MPVEQRDELERRPPRLDQTRPRATTNEARGELHERHHRDHADHHENQSGDQHRQQSSLVSRIAGTGELAIEQEGWKSDGVVLVSLRQIADRQEAMLLMPIHSWIRGQLGLFVVEPCTPYAWRALLEFRG